MLFSFYISLLQVGMKGQGTPCHTARSTCHSCYILVFFNFKRTTLCYRVNNSHLSFHLSHPCERTDTHIYHLHSPCGDVGKFRTVCTYRANPRSRDIRHDSCILFQGSANALAPPKPHDLSITTALPAHC